VKRKAYAKPVEAAEVRASPGCELASQPGSPDEGTRKTRFASFAGAADSGLA